MNDPDDPGRKVPDEGSSISEQLVAEIQEYLQEHYDVGGEREVPAPTPSPLPLAGEPPRRAAGSPATPATTTPSRSSESPSRSPPKSRCSWQLPRAPPLW